MRQLCTYPCHSKSNRPFTFGKQRATLQTCETFYQSNKFPPKIIILEAWRSSEGLGGPNLVPTATGCSALDSIAVSLAVHNNSIGDLVTRSVTESLSHSLLLLTLQSDPRDLWPLRHLIRVMRKHDLTTILTMFWFFLIFDIFCWQFSTIFNNFQQFWQF